MLLCLRPVILLRYAQTGAPAPTRPEATPKTPSERPGTTGCSVKKNQIHPSKYTVLCVMIPDGQHIGLTFLPETAICFLLEWPVRPVAWPDGNPSLPGPGLGRSGGIEMNGRGSQIAGSR